MIKSLLDEDDDQLLEINPNSRNESAKIAPTENFVEQNTLPVNEPVSEPSGEQMPAVSSEIIDSEPTYNFTLVNSLPAREEKPMFQIDFKPESPAETIRKSGLAYAAGITLFASIVFTMGIGWFADLMFGTSPWGIVGGIVLGSIIGFIQFFRITSQILKNKD